MRLIALAAMVFGGALIGSTEGGWEALGLIMLTLGGLEFGSRTAREDT